MALNKKVIHVDFSETSHLLNAVKSIANNLNQLAKKAHAINNIYAEDFDKMGGEWRPLCLLLSQYLSEAQSNAA